MQEWRLHQRGSSDHNFFLCLREGSKGKEPKKGGRPSTRRRVITEEQGKVISGIKELTPELVQKIKEAFTKVAATSLLHWKEPT